MDSLETTGGHTLDSLEALARVYDAPLERIVAKEIDHIDALGRAFIARSPFLLLATAGAAGVDCSPKGDAPGFVQVPDDRTLLIPDRPGNNRIDGMKNIVENPQVGILFLVPGANETFRVNGRARIGVDPALLNRFLVDGKPPRSVIVVTVDQAFNHCPKAFVRSRLWAAGAEGRPEGVPTTGRFAAARDGRDDAYAAAYDADYAVRMPKSLY
jgi:hypothetical protein